MHTTMKMFIAILLIFVVGCSPRICKVYYQINYLTYDFKKYEFKIDSTCHLFIGINTYKMSYTGRGFLSYIKDYYYFDFNKIDTVFTEQNITNCEIRRYPDPDTSFIPKNCRISVISKTKKSIIVKVDVKDDIIPVLINGKYQLKFDNPFPRQTTKYYRYYER